MDTNSFYKQHGKRALDVGLCSFALAALSPFFVAAAVGIKVSSPGPIFYASDRVGKDGEVFHFYKFRSMHQTDHDKGMFVADEDRLFAFGRLMRRLKIDELPQLINVLQGHMSIVGPRPMTPAGAEYMYGGKYAAVLRVNPGLTSAASLYDYTVGDTYTDDQLYAVEVVPVKRDLELYYVEHESFSYDADLIWRTMVTIVQVFLKKKKFRPLPEYEKVTSNKK